MTHLVVIGGFLGAGKTSAILSMAKHLLSIGQRVGIVTNDQGSDLVDTAFLAKEGLPVLEVNGGCFCCNFDEFSAKVAELAETQMPDVVLAEPVGSCTDLVATIFKPLQHHETKKFALRPLSILVDPKRLAKVMAEDEDRLFPDEINYLFKKQLEEADLLILNKTDLLTAEERVTMVQQLRSLVPTAEVLEVSVKNQTGIANWAEKTAAQAPSLRTIPDLDYDVYANAEASLGWLNSSLLIRFEQKTDINHFCMSFMHRISEAIKDEKGEIAHMKVYAMDEEDWLKVSQVSIQAKPEFNRVMENDKETVNMVINIRARISPEKLKSIVTSALEKQLHESKGLAEGLQTSCFAPARPNPTHRMV